HDERDDEDREREQREDELDARIGRDGFHDGAELGEQHDARVEAERDPHAAQEAREDDALTQERGLSSSQHRSGPAPSASDRKSRPTSWRSGGARPAVTARP